MLYDDEEDDAALFGGAGGLNSGQELDHEEVYVDPEPVELTSVAEATRTLTALEGRLHDIAYLQQDIREAGGMAQSFALEAERLAPAFAGKVPLGFYSVQPSGTRYRVSLEALHRTVWEMIKRAAAHISELIRRAIAWFTNKAEARETPEEAARGLAEKAQTNASDLAAKAEQIAQLSKATASGQVSEQPEVKGGAQRVLPNFDALVKSLLKVSPRLERCERFLLLANPVHHDMVYNGAYSQAFRKLAASLPSVRDLLEQRVALLEKLVGMDRHASDATVSALASSLAKSVVKPIELRFEGRVCTLSEAADHLGDVRRDVQSKETNRPMDLDHLADAVVQAYKSSDIVNFFVAQATILSVFASLEQSLAQLQKTAGSVPQDGSPYGMSEQLGGVVRDAVFAVGRDVTGYQALFAEMRQYGTFLERLTNETVAMAQEIEHELLKRVANGSLQAPPKWVEKAKLSHAERLKKLFGDNT